MLRRSVPFIIAATLIGVPATTASARARRTEIGPAQGVQATVTGTTVDIRFTGASAAFGKAHAGQRMFVSCAPHPIGALLFAETSTDDVLGRVARATVSADGSTLRVTRKAAPGDSCDLSGARDPRRLARAALTPAGAVWVDEQVLGTRMVDLAYAAAPTGVYRPAADVVKLGGPGVVALATPDATPPPGTIGYWSHGRAVSFVATSAAGKHLVLQDLGGGMLRTDVLEALLDWSPPGGFKNSSSGAGDASSGSGSSGKDEGGLGPGDGVTAHVEGGQVAFRFFSHKAAKVYRSVAGRRVTVMCEAVPPPPLLGGRLDEEALKPETATVRVPRHGGVLRATMPAHARDFCAIVAGKHEVAAAAPTKAGRDYFAAAIGWIDFINKAPDHLVAAGATRYAGADTIVAAQTGLLPMSTPGQALAPGTTGVWTDADRQALVALTTADGHRIVMADEGDGRVRTNVFGFLLSLTSALL
jgi:hypothetical protein